MTYQTASDWNDNSGSQISIAYAGLELKDLIVNDLGANFRIKFNDTPQDLENFIGDQSIITIPDIILIEVDKEEKCFALVEKLKKNLLTSGSIIIFLSTWSSKELIQKSIALKLHDLYTCPFSTADLRERINFLVRFKLIRPKLLELSQEVDITYKMPFGKRFLDLLIAGSMMMILWPVFLIVAIAIKLDSKGPVFYKSKRVGTGYRVFDFYKFRSMHTDADQMLATVSSGNQYTAEDERDAKVAFLKIRNDPRITKLGYFLRKTSLDELPQLFNIIKGNMSVVGNRPLPVYEAELLTSNEWSMRFLGPAGLTGLWQISKRGKESMSERERKKLDNFYAQKHSFWLDIRIIMGTVPALLQKERV